MNPLSSRLTHLRRLGLIAGAILLACLAGASVRAALISYLAAYIFWFGLALGCLNMALIHHLTGGAWGKVTRRFFEAGYMTLPVLGVLFVPVLFGVHELYPWANPATVAADTVLKHKSAYENVPAFALRAVLFFSIWIHIACRLRKWSLKQDDSMDASPVLHAKTLSGLAIVLVPLTGTFAFVDWVMSIEADWFSTIFSLTLLAGGTLIALALGILALAWLRAEIPFAGILTPKRFHDLGNLLLAFVMFWTYLAFSQFLIIYSGNQPREINWYLHRIVGGWQWLLMYIALFQFLAPFCILLFRSSKQNLLALAAVAAVIFLVNALQTFWAITPTFYPTGIGIHWTDFAAGLGIGGIWAGVFAANLKKHPLLIRSVMPSDPVANEMTHEN